VVIRDAQWRLVYAGEHANFDSELRDLLRTFNVFTVCIDANPETREARRFQGMYPNVFLCYYAEGKHKSDIDPMAFQTYGTDGYGERVWIGTAKVDRTRTLDGMFALFKRTIRGDENGATLPADIENVRDYAEHLKACERQIRHDSHGNEVAFYAKLGPDHYAHAENYAYIAMMWALQSAEHAGRIVFDPVRIGA